MRALMLMLVLVAGCSSGSSGDADAGPGPNVLTGSLAFPVRSAVVSSFHGGSELAVTLTTLTAAERAANDSATVAASTGLNLSFIGDVYAGCARNPPGSESPPVTCAVTNLQVTAVCVTGHLSAYAANDGGALDGVFAASVEGSAGCP